MSTLPLPFPSIVLQAHQLIAHQVFFTFKPGFSWQSTDVLSAEAATQGHVHHIPQIYGWFCGRSLIARDQAVDFSLIGYFKSIDDLQQYQVHPDHQRGVALWRAVSTWSVSDIIVDKQALERLGPMTLRVEPA